MVRLPSAEEALYWNLRLVPPSCEMAYVFRKKFIGEEIIEHFFSLPSQVVKVSFWNELQERKNTCFKIAAQSNGVSHLIRHYE